MMCSTSKIAQIQGASIVYQKFRNTEDQSRCCPLCTRDFENNDEIEMFRNQVRKHTFLSLVPVWLIEHLVEIDARLYTRKTTKDEGAVKGD